MTDVERARNEISKKQRKIDALKEAIDHLAEKLAAVRSSKRNKASQIARQNSELRAADAFAAAWKRGPDSEETHAAHKKYMESK